jgi:nucleoside-diphosphate-sugar epimerase
VRLVELDMARPEASDELAEILSGARQVINLTGLLARPGVPANEFARVHADGTRRLVAALAASKISRSRLIHVSTTGVLGPTGTTPRDEESIPAPSNPYERSKLDGETIALSARRPSREVVIVRPGLVYGPRDLHLLSWFRSIASGSYRPIAGGRAVWQPIHVDDVVRGIEAALQVPGADGQTFHFAGAERVSVADLGARISRALGDTNPPRGSLPYGLAMAAGAVLETTYKLWRGDPPLTRARVKTMSEHRVYDIERAERLLRFKPEVPLDEGLSRTVAWYRAEGLI